MKVATFCPLDTIKSVKTNCPVSLPLLNMRFTAAVAKPDVCVNKGTNLVEIPVSGSAVAIDWLPTCEPSGKTAPVAEIVMLPEPSPLIVAPFKSIVFPDR